MNNEQFSQLVPSLAYLMALPLILKTILETYQFIVSTEVSLLSHFAVGKIRYNFEFKAEMKRVLTVETWKQASRCFVTVSYQTAMLPSFKTMPIYIDSDFYSSQTWRLEQNFFEIVVCDR